MLYAMPSQTAPDANNLTVYYRCEPSVVLSLLAQLVRAYNPYGLIAPAAIAVKDVASLTWSKARIAELNQVLSGLAVRYGQLEQRLQPLSQFSSALTTMAGWLAMPSVPLQDYLFSPKLSGEPLDTPNPGSPQMSTPAAALQRIAKSGGGGVGWPTSDRGRDEDTDLVTDLALVTLWSSYGRLRDAAFLTGEIEAPKGAPRDVWPVVERTQRLATLVATLRASIAVAPLRELAAFLESPAIKPLFEYVPPDVKEQVALYASRLLGMAVHPWIAYAERLRIPARRYTQWGASTLTMGLSGAAEGGLWGKLLAFTRARDGGETTGLDVRSLVIGSGELAAQFILQARDFFMERELWDAGHVAASEAALSLVRASGSPPDLHLHGEKWRPLVMTGSGSSEPVTDLLQLLTRPRWPLTNGKGVTAVAGQADAFMYSAEMWVTGSAPEGLLREPLPRPATAPPLFIRPHRTEYDLNMNLKLAAPGMIRPVMDAEYFGDEDAIFRDFTFAGVADLLGFSGAEAMASSPALMSQLGHLFERKPGAHPVPRADLVAAGVTRVFISSRTRETFRVAVDLPSAALPHALIAFDARTAPTVSTVRAFVSRTLEVPPMIADTSPFADDAAAAAAAGLGAVVR